MLRNSSRVVASLFWGILMPFQASRSVADLFPRLAEGESLEYCFFEEGLTAVRVLLDFDSFDLRGLPCFVCFIRDVAGDGVLRFCTAVLLTSCLFLGLFFLGVDDGVSNWAGGFLRPLPLARASSSSDSLELLPPAKSVSLESARSTSCSGPSPFAL